MTQALIAELREWRIASAPYEPEYKVPPPKLHLKAADALERLTTCNEHLASNCEVRTTEIDRLTAELETANRIKIEQTDYAIGLQRAIEAHCREELALEDVCPHHAQKLNKHFNRQQVLEKEHREFYSELVTLRNTVEHLRLREGRLTAERDDLFNRMTTAEFESDALRDDAERYRKLCAILQKAYDTDSFESERLTIYCEQLSGWRNERTVEARLVWLDTRDAGLDLSSAIDAAIGEKHD